MLKVIFVTLNYGKEQEIDIPEGYRLLDTKSIAQGVGQHGSGTYGVAFIFEKVR